MTFMVLSKEIMSIILKLISAGKTKHHLEEFVLNFNEIIRMKVMWHGFDST